MKKSVLFFALFLFIGFDAYAQKGNNQISIGVDGALPVGDFGEATNFGIGPTVKGMYGIGSAGQLELTTGYLVFPFEESTSTAKGSSDVIPIFAGYRHHINGFYLEPQLGVAIINTTIDVEGFGSESSSESAFGWAVGAGYLFHAFDLSVRYQSATKDGGNTEFFAVRIGYNFSW